MQIVDSHCHLDRLIVDNNITSLDEIVQRAVAASVEHILCVCIDLPGFSDVERVAMRYPGVSASVGIHPTEEPNHQDWSKLVRSHAQKERVVAIGETGLDYFHETISRQTQCEYFSEHIDIAKSVGKPLIIHTRDARQDTIDILRAEQAGSVGGVLHCFTESVDMAKAACDLGFYISFSGIITFKNAIELREVAKMLPLDRILIETDAPYLAPVPHRGKTNEPSFVRFVAEQLAEIKNTSVEKVAEQTSENFYRLFSAARGKLSCSV